MVAPALDLAPRQIHRIAVTACAGAAPAGIEQPGESQRGLRRGGEPFGNLIAIDRQVGKALIR